MTGLASVTLQELNQTAALQTRVDRKYLISRSDVDELIDELTSSADCGPAVRVLEINERKQFGYWSTYFDTDQLSSFLDAARRRHYRFKVRVRTYLDTGATYLEVKTRSRRGQTVKTRIPTSTTSHESLGSDDQRFVVTTLTEELGGRHRTADGQRELQSMVSNLQPTLTTEYQRTTLLANDNSRVTLDHGLTVTLPDGTSRQLVDHVVVETKSGHKPSPTDRLLWDHGHRPVKFSKYGTGMVLLRPELPGSKWNRVLRQQLDWRPTQRTTSAPALPSPAHHNVRDIRGTTPVVLSWLPGFDRRVTS